MSERTVEQMLSDARLAKERAEKATPGPWGVDTDGEKLFVCRGEGDDFLEICAYPGDDDAPFISCARTDVPQLAADVETLIRQVDRLKSELLDHSTEQQAVDLWEANTKITEAHEVIDEWKKRAEAAETALEKLHSWDGLMSLLDEHWPADIFVGGGPNTDPGVRIVALMRWVDKLEREAEGVSARLAWCGEKHTAMDDKLYAMTQRAEAAEARVKELKEAIDWFFSCHGSTREEAMREKLREVWQND